MITVRHIPVTSLRRNERRPYAHLQGRHGCGAKREAAERRLLLAGPREVWRVKQSDARALAQKYRACGVAAVATTRDELARRWETTHEWVVVLPGERVIYESEEQESKQGCPAR